MKNKNLVTTVIVAVIVAAIAFFGGMQYQKTQAAGQGSNAQFAQGGFGNGQRGQRFGGAGGRNGFGGATVGDVVSVDADSITVKLQDGSSKIVDISGSTTYSKTDTGSKSDVKVGERIAAIGTTNSDGSITAQNIQLNPMFRVGPRRQNQPQNQ